MALRFAHVLGIPPIFCATCGKSPGVLAALPGLALQPGAGARLDWLPQETLLYQSCHLNRRTEIDLGREAECLLAETLILGRHAMGEVTTSAHLTDHRLITRQGRPVWAEALCLTPDVLTSQSPALLNGALAVVCLVAQGAGDAVGPVRAALDFGAASGWDGRCVVRLAAADGWTLKTQLARAVRILTGRPLPRVWASGGPTDDSRSNGGSA